MTTTGTLKSWNDERGFGFIEPANGGQELFVHIKAFSGLDGRPAVGQAVRFSVETTAEGKKRAVRVMPVRARVAAVRRDDSPAQSGTASYFAIPAFLLLYLIVAVVWQVPRWVAGWYVLASGVCFALYFIDKWAASSC